MPSASATWRAAISSSLASLSSTPNLDARLSLLCSEETRRRTHSSRSVAPSVARTILLSSSSESSEKVRTLCWKISLADRFLGLDRVHEAQLGARQRLGDQTHLGDRSDVIMADARAPERPEKLRAGIGLHRIQRLARKLLREEPCGAGCCLRANERYRCCRCEGKSYPQRAMVLVQFKGPPVYSAN